MGFENELFSVLNPAFWSDVSLETGSLLLVLFVAFVVASLCIVKHLRKVYLLNCFYNDYEVELPKKIKIRRRVQKDENYFVLAFPFWRYANKDGSCDRRYRDNKIVCSKSKLFVGDYVVIADNPHLIVWLTHALRVKNVSIIMSQEEIDKYNSVKYQRNQYAKLQTVLSIVQRFKERPTDFEEYCACIYRAKGYEASVTPRTGDGGYDIILKDSLGGTAIVECKCYNPKYKVGRQSVQKLVGANAALQAQKMIFITTSDFTPEACQYGRIANVELINGLKLFDMAKAVYGGASITSSILLSDWEFNEDDLSYYCPPDYFIG